MFLVWCEVYDPAGDGYIFVNLMVFGGRYFFNVIYRIFFVVSFRDQNRGGFVVSNGSLCFCFVAANDPVSITVDSGFVDQGVIFLDTGYPIKTVDDLNIFIAEIFIVAIDKPKIPAGNSIIADTVTGEDVNLHAIVCHKEMTAAAADTVCGTSKPRVKD